MENFFNDVFEYNLFKKALKATEGEPVVLNVQASDIAEKKPEAKVAAPVKRKNMSEKYEPSPFGKYFGTKRKRTTPLDMSDFSSWKNKNYRKIEEDTEEDFGKPKTTFSLSEYMKNKSLDRFNELDQAKYDLKKPITQLSVDDPDLKKYSLDSYMHKLEERVIADDKFKENDDLLEPLVNFEEDTEKLKDQDEDFSSNGVGIEQFALDDNSFGEEYSIDESDFDEVKRRLEILEKQTNKINEIESRNTEVQEESGDDSFTLSSLFADEEDASLEDEDEQVSSLERVIQEESEVQETQQPVVQETKQEKEQPVFLETKQEPQEPKAQESQEPEAQKKQEETEQTQPVPVNETAKQIIETISSEKPAQIERVEAQERKSETGELKKVMSEKKRSYTKLNRNNILTKEDFIAMTDNFMSQFAKTYEEKKHLQEKPQNKPETTINSSKNVSVSDLKSQSEREARLAEIAFESKKKTSKAKPEATNSGNKDLFKKELKSNHNISNLEMDNKLLKISNRLNKQEEAKKEEKIKPIIVIQKQTEAKPKAEVKVTPAKPASNKRKRGKSKRRLDGDIIGDIDFD